MIGWDYDKFYYVYIDKGYRFASISGLYTILMVTTGHPHDGGALKANQKTPYVMGEILEPTGVELGEVSQG